MQEETQDAIGTAATAVSIVVEQSASNKQQQLKIAVSSLCPRKRTHAKDPISQTIQHFCFWDDKRCFMHLDSLLTRLAPLAVVHLSSTERAQPPAKNPSPAAIAKAEQVATLLEKMANMISTRTDLAVEGDMNDSLVNIHSTPPTKTNDLEDSLQHLLDEPSFIAFRGQVLEPIVLKSLSLLLHAQGLAHSGNAPTQCTTLEQGVLTSHLVLDRTASDAIHLLPPPSQVGMTPNPNSSLYGILNRCKTTMGSRELKAWLRQPLVVLEDIQKRQDCVTFLLNNGVDRLRDEALAGWPDVDVLATKLDGYKDNVTGPTCRALSNLYKLYLLAIQQVPILREALEDTVGDSEESSLLKEISQGIKLVETELTLSKQLVETMLDLEEAPRNFLVKSDFQSEMDEIKQELDSLEEEFDECLADMNKDWETVSSKKDQVRLEALDNGDWQFRLANTNDSKLLQARFEGITVHRMLKNGVYFSTKELRQLATKKQDLLAEYDKFQRQIVVDAMKVAATYVPVLERCSALVSQLDVLCSLAHVAAYSPTGYCRPTLTDGEEDGLGIELKGARHPCVELQENTEYIPNDISLIFGESSFLMVTGPNMGGKSTYIRALGAIVTLAQIGAYVPCTEAKINIVHHILARVGAGDVQNSGISTFMAEMLEASSILRTATKRSLIIIDELGRGTSTFDGFGLATAISEWIIEKVGCMTVFATHFHELTSLEDRLKEAKNCHVTATATEGNGLTFLYEVRPGPCLESFGIKVAEMANVPATVIADAKRRAKHLENFGSRKKQKTDDEALLARFKSIPFDKMNEEERKQALQNLVSP